MLALTCVLLVLALVAVILGVSIGISAKNKGRYPWWAKGEVDTLGVWLYAHRCAFCCSLLFTTASCAGW